MSFTEYMSGFGNEFATEALADVLPKGRNSPQKVAQGLYAEQLSGTPFTAPRAANRRSWLYRIRPGARHTSPYREIDPGLIRSAPLARYEGSLPIGQRCWNAPKIPAEPLTFIAGLRTITTAGDIDIQTGLAMHIALVTRSMADEYFVNIDGELLVVAQHGRLRFRTELGVIEIEPEEICVIPRGVTFKVELIDGPARAYVCENYGRAFALPELGPIGANGLANPRDFLTPVAAFEDVEAPCTLITKSGGKLYASDLDQSPLDVVAWHGNHAPYKYDLRTFCPMGTVAFDHQDPSVYTVLTSPSETAGFANIDFLVFGARWIVAEDTFRPAWYHRNFASEFMGGMSQDPDYRPQGYDAGGFNLHNQMLPHGVDSRVFEQASTVELRPQRIRGGSQFMVETRLQQHLTRYAEENDLQENYLDRWSMLPRQSPPMEQLEKLSKS